VSDYTEVANLITGLKAEHLVADKGYDSDKIVKFATEQGMIPVISSRRNRKKRIMISTFIS